MNSLFGRLRSRAGMLGNGVRNVAGRAARGAVRVARRVASAVGIGRSTSS